MSKFITQFILIGISISIFFVSIKPLYENISELRKKLNSYKTGLNDAKTFTDQRDDLTTRYNSIPDKTRIEKLLPDNVDNIRLILEIRNIANKRGMDLRDVKYEKSLINKEKQDKKDKKETEKNYGAWELEFSTQGSYKNFLSFLNDLENNLRIIDILSIQFSSDQGSGVKPDLSSEEKYKYSFKIKTYWLKN